MPQTLTAKILKAHLLEGEALAGNEISLKIDQTLTQDATGTLAALEFETLGLDRVKTEVSVSYVDHNILQGDFKNPDDHRYLQSFARKYGLWFSPAGNGICHQLHLLNFGKPGKTLLGSDSHTPHGGGVGMLAMGAGGLDVAAAMAGQPFSLTCPKVLGIRIVGSLPPGVDAKNIILELLRLLTVKGGVGRVLEYHGPGVAGLEVWQRAAICNMGAELGATGSLFPSDEATRRFMQNQGRPEDYLPLSADPGCEYDEMLELDLAALEPLVARPSSPDNVALISSLRDVAIEQVIVGSCGGASYEDMMTVALALKGKKIASGVNLSVNPGSRRALAQLAACGALGWLLESGARLHQSGCLGCIGMSQAPATGTASLRTFPRNFPGRSGTQNDQVYLGGPLAAAAAALTGRLSDPRELDLPAEIPPAPHGVLPDSLVPPPTDGREVQILRGPNIAPFPKLPPLPPTLTAKVALVVEDNITTDHIMPAGSRVLPLRSNIPAISRFIFNGVDQKFTDRCRQMAPAVIVGGENYGQGSSREHAALAPRHLGVVVKIAKSFARIHRANLINFGIVPLVFQNPLDHGRLSVGDAVEFGELASVILNGGEKVKARAGGKALELLFQASPREREILVAGGRLNHIRNQL